MQDTTEMQIFQWREIARLALRERGIRSGLWRIGVGLRFAPVNAGTSEAEMLPGAIVGIESIVLSPATEGGPLTFDAAGLFEEARQGVAPPSAETHKPRKRKGT
jgi:hypothetical protein